MKTKLPKPPGNVVVESVAGKIAGIPPTFRLEKVLVPIDFSACSKKALQYAIPFAKQFKAGIVFLHVIPFHLHYADGGFETKPECKSGADLEADAGRRLTALVKEVVPIQIPVEIKIRHGVESAEIVNQAKESEVDIVILSTHGRTGRAHSLVGSVAEDVVRLAPCPVLVVREHQHELSILKPLQKTATATL